jgi:hypothetical protein
LLHRPTTGGATAAIPIPQKSSAARVGESGVEEESPKGNRLRRP